MTQPIPLPLPLKTAAPLTQAELERHLWAAADILRGSIDSADYKHCIFAGAVDEFGECIESTCCPL